MPNRRAALLFALVLATTVFGCAHVYGRRPLAGTGVPTGVFRAGAARVDLTPPPGFPTGGHSLEGRMTRGHWLRLYARALYVEDAGGRAMALVSCDLWSMPSGLGDRVAELLATEPSLQTLLGDRRLGREQLLLAATHTHHSPAAYSTDRFFSTFSGVTPGFDPTLFEFLAGRIALAIARSVDAAVPARVSYAADRVAEAFRNRSFMAFLRNAEAQGLLAENADLPLCETHPLYPDTAACRAVDPTVRVLRLDAVAGDEGKGRLIGAAVFFAAHPTVISHSAELYQADLTGAVATRVERGLAAEKGNPGTPVVAVFNGAEGDVSAAWATQDRSKLLRLSELLAAKVREILRTMPGEIPLGERPVVEARFARMSLAAQKLELADGRSVRTALVPMPGGGTMCGAEDGPSELGSNFAREGKRGPSIGPHGTKIGSLDLLQIGGVVIPPFWLTRLATSLLPPERWVDFSVYRLGPLRIVSLPGEITTIMGQRIAARVAASLRIPVANVVLAGVAQSFGYYFATPEEYDLQHYEGSGTLFGKYAGELLAVRLAALAASDPDPDSGRTRFSYHPGIRRSFGMRKAAADVLDGGTHDVVQVTRDDAPVTSFPRECWDDAVPPWPPPDRCACVARDDGNCRVTPRIWIEVRRGEDFEPLVIDGAPENDDGLDIVTLGARTGRNTTRWCTYWLPPKQVDMAAEYRFAWARLDGTDGASAVGFRLR